MEIQKTAIYNIMGIFRIWRKTDDDLLHNYTVAKAITIIPQQKRKRPEAHNLMKVSNHKSSIMLRGKQEGTLNESLCAQAQPSHCAYDASFLFNFKSRRCWHIKVNLKLEAGASESSPPSHSQSPARALPDSDASTSEIFMNSLIIQQDRNKLLSLILFALI